MSRPFGYERDRQTVREDEADVVRDAAKRILAGESLRSVVQTLNAAGTPTANGGQWQPVQLKRTLLNPRYVGKRNVKGRRLRADWPAILDDVTFKRLTEQLTDPKRRLGGRPSHRVYLLTGGLAVCGLCGNRLIARPTKAGKRAYVCTSAPPISGCGKIRMSADPLESYVIAQALARISSPRSAEKVQRQLQLVSSGGEHAAEQLADVEQRLADLARDYGEQQVTRDEWRAARAALMERRRSYEKAVEAAAESRYDATSTEALVAWWSDATLGQKRAILDALVARVEVHPAVKPGSHAIDESRIKIVWK